MKEYGLHLTIVRIVLVISFIIMFLIAGCKIKQDELEPEKILFNYTKINDSNISNIIINETGLNDSEQIEKNDSKISDSNAEDNQNENVLDSSHNKLIMFHNGRGPMCLKQLEYFESTKEQYPFLVIEEHLTNEEGTYPLLLSLESQYEKSEGVSNSFEYLPITFINNHAYSGFNEEVKEKLEKDIQEVCK